MGSGFQGKELGFHGSGSDFKVRVCVFKVLDQVLKGWDQVSRYWICFQGTGSGFSRYWIKFLKGSDFRWLFGYWIRILLVIAFDHTKMHRE
jgi:hypothetical protein